MGYHIITNIKNGKLNHQYLESFDDLIYKKGDIPNSAIVYEADKQWRPYLLTNHPTLKDVTDDNKLVGRRAELKFERLAQENGFVVQRIDQCQKSFYQYKKIVGIVKRSDYLIMNLPNVEIDVKCLTKYEISGSNFYHLNKEEVDKHKVILNEVKRHLVFAIFERGGNWYRNETLKMIHINDVERCDVANINGKAVYLLREESLIPDFLLLKEIKHKSLQPVFSNTNMAPQQNNQDKNNKLNWRHAAFTPTMIVCSFLFGYFAKIHSREIVVISKNIGGDIFVIFIMLLFFGFVSNKKFYKKRRRSSNSKFRKL